MDSKEHLQNNNIITKENWNTKTPIKQLHHLDGKYFIVLDESIIERLELLDDNNYFQQETTTDGRIILKKVSCRDEIS